MGGIKRATTPDEAAAAASGMLGMRVKGFTVDQVLVEERLDIAREFYAGVIVDDCAQAPLVLFSSVGGTGIEEIAAEHPEAVAQTHVDIESGLMGYQACNVVRWAGLSGKLQRDLGGIIARLYDVARTYEARAAEINPLVQTTDGKLYAADCRITVDDYAVFRHPDLGITFARELDRPPTELERIAYEVEANDYRGTFYFIQMAEGFEKGQGYVGFHGAGGGGSMMSMDAVLNQGFKLATYVDTSGNPPASKVYRAARIILSSGPVDGYFGSGSGVASQEQFHSAREKGIKVYDVNAGIGSHVAIEEGLAVPGCTFVGTDSYLNILGAVGAFGQGMGDQDIAFAFKTGKTWFEVPPTDEGHHLPGQPDHGGVDRAQGRDHCAGSVSLLVSGCEFQVSSSAT